MIGQYQQMDMIILGVESTYTHLHVLEVSDQEELVGDMELCVAGRRSLLSGRSQELHDLADSLGGLGKRRGVDLDNIFVGFTLEEK